jgi:hypothetical protein
MAHQETPLSVGFKRKRLLSKDGHRKPGKSGTTALHPTPQFAPIVLNAGFARRTSAVRPSPGGRQGSTQHSRSADDRCNSETPVPTR